MRTRCGRVADVVVHVKSAERLIVVIQKGISDGSAIFVDDQAVLELLGLDFERSVLHPHVIVFEVLEYDPQDHVVVMGQSVVMRKIM